MSDHLQSSSNTSHAAGKTQSARHAFTLLEMCCSMIVLAVLLLACGSILSLATKTATDGAARTATQLGTADAVAQLTDDLDVATNFTARSSSGVTFTVPNRSGGTTPQTVQYAWSGTAGAPITRQFNGGSTVQLIPAAQSFSLGYLTRTMGSAAGPSEQQVLAMDAAVALSTAKDQTIDSTHWASECFFPSLPLLTSSYSITRVRLKLKASGPNDGILAIKIYNADLTLLPKGTLLATATVYESALSTNYEYVDVPFTTLTGINPLQGICVVVSSTAAGVSANWGYQTALLSILSGNYWSTSTNAGSSWAAVSALSGAYMDVYGTVP